MSSFQDHYTTSLISERPVVQRGPLPPFVQQQSLAPFSSSMGPQSSDGVYATISDSSNRKVKQKLPYSEPTSDGKLDASRNIAQMEERYSSKVLEYAQLMLPGDARMEWGSSSLDQLIFIEHMTICRQIIVHFYRLCVNICRIPRLIFANRLYNQIGHFTSALYLATVNCVRLDTRQNANAMLHPEHYRRQLFRHMERAIPYISVSCTCADPVVWNLVGTTLTLLLTETELELGQSRSLQLMECAIVMAPAHVKYRLLDSKRFLFPGGTLSPSSLLKTTDAIFDRLTAICCPTAVIQRRWNVSSTTLRVVQEQDHYDRLVQCLDPLVKNLKHVVFDSSGAEQPTLVRFDLTQQMERRDRFFRFQRPSPYPFQPAAIVVTGPDGGPPLIEHHTDFAEEEIHDVTSLNIITWTSVPEFENFSPLVVTKRYVPTCVMHARTQCFG